jgi:membrane-associated phospholipid phosphatase
VRASRLIRATAWAVVAVGVAAPTLRRTRDARPRRLPAPVVLAAAAAAPVALCVAVPRSRRRDVATCVLQMWAYLAAYEMPHDDPAALERRVRVDYPIRIDRILGAGSLPTLRIQGRLGRPGAFSPPEKVLVWAHWIWFTVPHGTLLYILLRHRERFPRAAVMTYAVFDIGAVVYWVLPTAPPWYAAGQGRLTRGQTRRMRRMMIEYGEQFWGAHWSPLYGFLAGNPLAAMPSLHFATSVMAADLLSELGSVEGAVGWTYAMTLGLALVYLGEHYVVDLLAGLALTRSVRRGAPRAAPLLAAVSRSIQRVESRAHAA